MLSRRLLRTKVLKALYARLKSESANDAAAVKNLMMSVDKAYELYVHVMNLIVCVKNYAEERQEIALHKQLPTYEDLNPNRRFVENCVVRLIEQSESVKEFSKAHKLSWHDCPELIKTLYNQLVSADYFKAYMSAEKCSFRDDVRVVEEFFKNEPDNCEMLEEVLEEQSLMWRDDLNSALIMVLRTLSNVRRSTTEITLLPKFKNEDDADFTRTLFTETLGSYDESLKIVERFASNWDLERIAFMDNLIMAMAMTELRCFPSIPVKVTLDEYIEISKYYSTANSGQFINGVLDKVVEEFTADGRISKSGTGLL